MVIRNVCNRWGKRLHTDFPHMHALTQINPCFGNFLREIPELDRCEQVLQVGTEKDTDIISTGVNITSVTPNIPDNHSHKDPIKKLPSSSFQERFVYVLLHIDDQGVIRRQSGNHNAQYIIYFHIYCIHTG